MGQAADLPIGNSGKEQLQKRRFIAADYGTLWYWGPKVVRKLNRVSLGGSSVKQK